MPKRKVGILMGGNSAEHEISLLSGAAVFQALRDSLRYDPQTLKLTRDHVWMRGEEPLAMENALRGIECAFLAFHGEWGEDGRMQAILEYFGIPYTGSQVASSALGMYKPASKQFFRAARILVPEGIVLRESAEALYDRAQETARILPGPWVVKPAGRGSSVGVSIVRNAKELPVAMKEAFSFDRQILVEEYLDGVEVSCGVLEQKNGEDRALPPTQIIPPPKHEFFDFYAKYSGETIEITPAPIEKYLIQKIQEAALLAHAALGCRHYSRVDMILHNGKPYVLELNTLPGLTEKSLIPEQARAIGIPFPKLIEHIVDLALPH